MDTTLLILFCIAIATGEQLSGNMQQNVALTADASHVYVDRKDVQNTRTEFGGVWSSWKEYTCSVTCGQGMIVRTRNCTNTNPQTPEETCIGSEREVDLCQQSDCPVVGVWMSWADSVCSVTCGLGTLTRTRNCSATHPETENNLCVGSDREVLLCREADCPVIDGGWSGWTETNPCGVTCGTGKRLDNRTCSNPEPLNGGKPCDGPSNRTVDCAEQPCPDCVGNNTVWLTNTRLCVYISTDAKTHIGAETACEEMCGRLIQIRDSSMLDELHGRLPSSYYFIDGSDAKHEGWWYFTDGDPLWTHWASGEPNSGATANCLMVSTSYLYYDQHCVRYPYNYVCEILRG